MRDHSPSCALKHFSRRHKTQIKHGFYENWGTNFRGDKM